jgi:hypothetical protein
MAAKRSIDGQSYVTFEANLYDEAHGQSAQPVSQPTPKVWMSPHRDSTEAPKVSQMYSPTVRPLAASHIRG